MRLSALVLLLALVSCKKKEEEKPAKPVVRSVLTMTVGSADSKPRPLVCNIQARYTTQLAFRLAGRVVRRSVSVGDPVKKGDEIGAIDQKSLRLQVAAASASVYGSAAQQKKASLTLDRQDMLLARGSVSKAKRDEARASSSSAAASVDEAAAQLHKAREDLSYGVLRAEFDGVVTSVNFEVDQVVSANQVIAEMARPDVVDVVCDAPESVARDTKFGDTFEVRSAEEPVTKAGGRVRQVEPSAERETRTRRIWVALLGMPAGLKLGTTMYAERSGLEKQPFRLPPSAIFDRQVEGPAVWVVEGEHISQKPVKLASRTEDGVLVEEGLNEGERVVTAGVHLLKPGQHVKLAEDAQQ